MTFLLPVAGVVDFRFGVLTTYQHRSVPAGIKAGMLWAGDNCAFTRGFDGDKFWPWLRSLNDYRATCLFIAVPDVVGDAKQTLNNWQIYRPLFVNWPTAFVAQDGQEDLALPDDFDVLFVGGSTAWKESESAVGVIKQAQALGKRIHIGRVNWRRRYQLFRILDGSGEFTCDGTRTRFEGQHKTINAWAGYMAQSPLITI